MIIGLTGGIASGKSEVAKVLKEHGALVYDADKIAHQLYKPGTPLYKSLILEFGQEILNTDKNINRAKLADIVFTYAEKRQKLNELVHPAVIDHIKRLIAAYKEEPKKQPLVIQVPLLIEAKMMSLFDCIVVVITTPELQFERLKAKGLSPEQIFARLQAQISDAERLKYADFTLINKGPLNQLKESSTLLYHYLVA